LGWLLPSIARIYSPYFAGKARMAAHRPTGTVLIQLAGRPVRVKLPDVHRFLPITPPVRS
jgi:hypothetical protein